MDINARIARRVRALRRQRELSLDALAGRCGVSRSHISLIERGHSSPTATVLDRLATGLGVAVASLFEDDGPGPAPPSPLSRRAQQPVWTDPASGYVRRNLSPSAVGSAIQLVEVDFPAGQRVAFDTTQRDIEIWQQIWVINGAMEVTLDGTPWRLESGDCLAMRLDRPITYRNPTRSAARYLVALASLPGSTQRRS